MEKMNFLRGGVVRMPPGFRFHPTDEELVVQYLKRKVFSCPLPSSIIPEIDVFKLDPWDLAGDWSEERYFFTIRGAKYPKGSRANRGTASGYWKATGLDRQISASRSNQVVGMKKALVFYRGKAPNGCRTDWIMHEYRLADAAGGRGSIVPLRKNSNQNSMMQMEDWVLCRIFLKKRTAKNAAENSTHPGSDHAAPPRIRFIDFLAGESAAGSDVSGVTEISSAGSLNEESSSCNNSFSSSSQRE